MAKFLTLQNVSFLLSNGETLFDSIQFKIQHSFSAFVGPNGTGKSVLAKICANELPAHTGLLSTNANVHYVAQQWAGNPLSPAKDALGLTHILDAISRIESGSIADQDFVLAEPWWNWQEQLDTAMRAIALTKPIDLSKPISAFSGGEQFRLMWLAAILAKPDIYIFDEPTNHLDTQGRQTFFNWVRNQSKPIVAVSHDRELLSKVDAIYELTKHQLYFHSGNFLVFKENQQQRWQAQQSELEQARKHQRAIKAKLQSATEKQQQKAAKGKHAANKEGWSRLERGGAKEQASASISGAAKQANKRESSSESKAINAEQKREWFEPISFQLPMSNVSQKSLVLALEKFQIRLNDQLFNTPYTLEIRGAQRIHLRGENGSGKSLLIKAIVGHWQHHQGSKFIHVPYCYLGQSFLHFDQQASSVDLFSSNHPSFSRQDAQERLAWLGLRNEKANIPFGDLSGGEQMKCALAINLLGKITPKLIFLDEPSNHLDLDSIKALEQALNCYQGAMILASHDKAFVNTLSVTHEWDIKNSDLTLV